MGPQFFQTGMGKKFYESDFPELVRQLKRLNDNLEKPNVVSHSATGPKESPMQEALRLNEEAKAGSNKIDMDEKECADFIASVLPGATVVPKDMDAYIKLHGIEQAKIDFPEAYKQWLIEGHYDEKRSEPEYDYDKENYKVCPVCKKTIDYHVDGFVRIESENKWYCRDHAPEPPITITRYTPEQARKIPGVEEQGFLDNRISRGFTTETKVIAVLGVLLPNCGELYISEYGDGHFWTQGPCSDEWGTLDQCIKHLKEEFL